MNCQALSAIKHGSTTQTDLLSCAKGGGEFVLSHATIYTVIEVSGGALWCCRWSALPSFGHLNTSLRPFFHDRWCWHPQPCVPRPEWLDGVLQWSQDFHGIHGPCHSRSRCHCERYHLG